MRGSLRRFPISRSQSRQLASSSPVVPTYRPSDMMGQVMGALFQGAVDEAVEKALKDGRKQEGEDQRNKAWMVDPYSYTSSQGMWREKPSRIVWETLRSISYRNPIIAGIINTRISMVAAFSQQARLREASGNIPMGYRIISKHPGKAMTEAEKRFAEKLEDFIWVCGAEAPGTVYDRDNFDTWLRKSVRDSLTFDAAATELVPTRSGSLYEFHAVDAATVRIAKVKQEIDNEEEQSAFVQVVNGQIVARFAAEEMMYAIRNPVTDIRNNGYGVSEIEQLITVVTNLFNAMTHNAMFFRNGAAVKGILNIKKGGPAGAQYGDAQIEAFKRAWNAMVTGQTNAWKTPIIQSEGVEFIDMGRSNRDMEFLKYLEFLVKLTCSIFLIDPSEIGYYMTAGSGGQGSMFEGNQGEKLQAGKDKGLRPLLTAFERWINEFMIARIAPEFYFTWVGIDQQSEKDVIALRQQEVGAYKTLDEVRADAGLEPLGPDRGGDLVLNSTYTMALQQKQMAQMQEQQMAQQGADQGGAEGDDSDQQDQGQDGGEEAQPDASEGGQNQSSDDEGANGQDKGEGAQKQQQDARPLSDEELRRMRPDLGDFYDQGGDSDEQEEDESKGKSQKQLKKSIGVDVSLKDLRKAILKGDRKYLSIVFEED